MDTKFLQKGMKTEELPESFVIFITENDVLKGGYPVYHIDRIVAETGKLDLGDKTLPKKVADAPSGLCCPPQTH